MKAQAHFENTETIKVELMMSMTISELRSLHEAIAKYVIEKPGGNYSLMVFCDMISEIVVSANDRIALVHSKDTDK